MINISILRDAVIFPCPLFFNDLLLKNKKGIFKIVVYSIGIWYNIPCS